MTADLDPVRRLYAEPRADELQAALPALAARIHAELDALAVDPSRSRCDGVVLSLYGATTHVQRLRMVANHEHEKAHVCGVG
jgi:hypothetical protein